MCDHNCNVCDKFKKYKCKQYNDLKPPNVAGKWDRTNRTVLLHNNLEQDVSFKNIEIYPDDIVTITQCGVFVIFQGEPNELRPTAVERLGIWNPLRAADGSVFSWQLMVVDNDDTEIDILQPSKFDRKGKVIQLYNSYAESGFNKENPLQQPAVSYYYMDRI
ncbi:Hypothetical protein HVR_LOCUS286 [uncultured virus]|nr:Hypothetical protein HVR_LOCUS286 [uncultured virus]